MYNEVNFQEIEFHLSIKLIYILWANKINKQLLKQLAMPQSFVWERVEPTVKGRQGLE